MTKFRRNVIIFALLMIIAHLILLDYRDLSWEENSGNYAGILAMIFAIISIVLSDRGERNNVPVNPKK